MKKITDEERDIASSCLIDVETTIINYGNSDTEYCIAFIKDIIDQNPLVLSRDLDYLNLIFLLAKSNNYDLYNGVVSVIEDINYWSPDDGNPVKEACNNNNTLIVKDLLIRGARENGFRINAKNAATDLVEIARAAENLFHRIPIDDEISQLCNRSLNDSDLMEVAKVRFDFLLRNNTIHNPYDQPKIFEEHFNHTGYLSREFCQEMMGVVQNTLDGEI